MKCNDCGHEIVNENARFCPLCGADQQAAKEAQDVSACPHCGAAIVNEAAAFCSSCGGKIPVSPRLDVEKRFCSACGNEIAAKGLSFCPKCGKSLSAEPKPQPKRFCPGCGTEVADESVDFCSNCGCRLNRPSIDTADLLVKLKSLININGISDVEKKSGWITAASMTVFALFTFTPLYAITNIPFLSGSYSLISLLSAFAQYWQVFSSDGAVAAVVMTWSFFVVVLWCCVIGGAGYSIYCVLEKKRCNIKVLPVASIFGAINLLSVLILDSSMKSAAGKYSSLVSSINVISCTPCVWFLTLVPLAVFALCWALSKNPK